eukprot:scaffold7371_cov121-Isochrysis_galbana.AAC.4
MRACWLKYALRGCMACMGSPHRPASVTVPVLLISPPVRAVSGVPVLIVRGFSWVGGVLCRCCWALLLGGTPWGHVP